MKRIKSKFVIITGIILMTFMVVSANAALIHVPADYATIQGAVDAASSGDVISVAAGTYVENVLIDKSLTLIAEGTGYTSIIDGGGGDCISIFASNVVVDGFKISNGAYGMYIGGGTGPYDNITVSNCEITGNSKYGIQAIGLSNMNHSNITISETYVHNNQRNGIKIFGCRDSYVSDCRIENNGLGGGSSEYAYTFGLWFGTTSSGAENLTNLQCVGNTFSGNLSGSIILKDVPGPSDITGAAISNNDFSGDMSGYGIYNAHVSATIDASGNWWGDLDPSDNLSGSVDYTPWLGNGTDTESGTPGFQGDFATLYVDDDSPQVGTTGYIQEGIDLVSGSTIYVAAGMYVETLLIDKPLTLLGATAGVNKNGYTVPTGYAWDDAVESIIMHPNPAGGYVTIVDIYDTDDVTFDGFIVQELNASGNLNTSLLRVYAYSKVISNINVINSVIGPNTNTVSQDGTQGRMGLYIVNHPYNDNGIINSTFAGNKIFDCKGNGNNIFLWSSYYAYGASGPASMAGTVIEDNEIYGSHRSGIETAGGFSDLVIRNNEIYGNSELPGDDVGKLKYGNGILLIRGSSDKVSDPLTAYGPVNLTVEGNNIYGNSKNGIYMGPKNDGVTLNNNAIYGNGWDGVMVDLLGTYWNPQFEAEPTALQYSCLDCSNNVTVFENTIYGNGTAGNSDAEFGAHVNGIPTNDFELNATQNYWGTTLCSEVASNVFGEVAYDPWCNSDFSFCDFSCTLADAWVDDDWIGYSYGDDAGGHIFGYNAFATIQEGIDAVNGSTVHVAAGTYREQLYIDKDLNLLGSGSGDCIVEAPDPGNRSTYTITQWTGSVKTIDAIMGINTAGTVNIDGFNIDGRDTGPGNFYGISFFDTDGSVTNCIIDNITYSTVPGTQSVASLLATHSLGATFTINITGNTIPIFQKGGIVLMGPGCSFSVNDNNVTGQASSSIAGNCIQLSYGAHGSTSGNYVEGTTYTGEDWASTGILLFESGDVSMDGDEVYNCQSGVNFSDWGWVYLNPTPVNLDFTNLNLHDNEWTLGFQLSRDNSDVNLTVTNSSLLDNGGDGLDLWGSGVDPWGGSYYAGWSNGDLTAVITGCTITNSVYDGIWTADLSGNTNNTADIDVHGCYFTGNTSSAVNNTMTQTVDATGCFWDDPTGPTVGSRSRSTRQAASLISPFGDDLPKKGTTFTASYDDTRGSGETVLGPVSYSPFWMANYIGDPHTSSWSWGVDNTGTIGDGITAASAGDIVTVYAGTYYETLNITTPDLTIIGENRASVIIDPTGLASNNAGIYLATGADNVTVQSLTLQSTVTSSLPRYGIKFGEVDGCTLEDVTVREVYRSGIDALGTSYLTISNVSSLDNGGHGLSLVDCNDVVITDITLSGNGWQNVSVATWGRYSPLGTSGIVFNGTNSFGDLFQLEMGDYNNPGVPPAGEAIITYSTNPIDGADVTVQASDFGFALHGTQDDSPDQSRIWFFSILENAAMVPAMAPIGHWTGDAMYIESLTDGTQLYITPGCSIQAAVAAAFSGDIITVYAGTYAEGPQIVIDKNITIAGVDRSTVTITPTANTGSSGDPRGWFLVQAGASMDLSEIMLDGAGFNIYQGIRAHGDVTLTSVDFRNIGFSKYVGFGCAIMDATLTVDDCTLENIGRVGLMAFGPGSTGNLISNCNYVGKGDGDWLDYGVEFGNGAVGTIDNCDISNNIGVAASDGSTSAGIIATTYYGPGTAVTITNCNLHDNTQGIGVGYDASDGTTVTASNNTIVNNPSGGIASTSTVEVNAEENYWGSLSCPEISLMVSGMVDFDPWCNSDFSFCGFSCSLAEVWVDDDWVGLSEGDPIAGHIFGYDAFDIIADGVNAVSDAGIVHVFDGNYDTPINIDNRSNLSILGESQVGTIFKPATTLDWGFAPYGSGRQVAVRVVSSTGITLSNMTMDFDLIKADNVFGLLFWNSSGEISDNTMQNMNTAGYYEFISYLRAPDYTDGARAQIDILNNTFLKTGRVGIVVHDYVNTLIEGNNFDKVDDDFGYAIELGSMATGTIRDNVFSNYDTWAATDQSTVSAIYVENSFTMGVVDPISKPVTIEGNDITNCQYGIIVGNEVPGYAGNVDIVITIEDNNISNNSTSGSLSSGGIIISDEGKDAGSSINATIHNNMVFNNGDYGIFINTDGNGDISTTITENIIGSNYTGISIKDYATTSTSSYNVIVHHNFFDNYLNAEDDVAGGYWDDLTTNTGNCWSDWETNSGYPIKYEISGNAGTRDRKPNTDYCNTMGDCTTGEANGEEPINILDIVYIINYVYKDGPDPIPYTLCSADPNCDCTVNILDVVYLINSIYKEGPAPCGGSDWMFACKLPIRGEIPAAVALEDPIGEETSTKPVVSKILIGAEDSIKPVVSNESINDTKKVSSFSAFK